jgi:uncharacterized membrane protein
MVPSEKRFWVVLGVIAVVQWITLACLLTHKSFTIDEAYELRHLSTNLIEIAKDSDGFPPLYRWLLSLQILVTGEMWARGLSAVVSALTTLVVGLIGRQISSVRTGLFCAFFFSTSACQWEYAQQCRAYSLYILATALLTLAFLWVHRQPTKLTWGILAASSGLAFLTHYYALFYIAVLWICKAILIAYDKSTLDEKKQEITHWISAGLVLVILSVPTLFCLRIDLLNPVPQEVVNPVDLTALAYTFLSLAQGWCLGPSSIELQEMGLVQGVLQMAPWATLSLGASAILLWSAWRENESRVSRVMIIAVIIVPLLVSGLSWVILTSYVSRYLACLIVPVSIVAGVGASAKGRALPKIAMVFLVGLNLLSIVQRNTSDRYDRENYRLVQSEISERDASPRIVIVSHYLAHAVKRELPSHYSVDVIGFYSDEPDHERIIAEKPLESVFTPGTWIITDWFVPGSDLEAKRDQMIRAVGAEIRERISNTVQLYQVPVD